MALAHIRNGQLITIYDNEEGWVFLENGDQVTPPEVGYQSGNDKVVSVREVNTIEAVSNRTETVVTTEVMENEVVRTTTIADITPTSEDVNIERDRRIAQPFKFEGKLYDYDEGSAKRITGAGALAAFAIGAGAEEGDYRWQDPDRDFVWIANDNSLTYMDAHACLRFAKAAADWVSDHIFTARVLKNMAHTPADFNEDTYWPNND